MGVGCRVGAGTVGAGAGAGIVGEFQGQNCAAAGGGNIVARKDTAATTVGNNLEDDRGMIGNFALFFPKTLLAVESTLASFYCTARSKPVTTTKNERLDLFDVQILSIRRDENWWHKLIE